MEGSAIGEANAQYSAIVLGATGNVGGRIIRLLIKNPLCKTVVVVTRMLGILTQNGPAVRFVCRQELGGLLKYTGAA